MKYILITLIVLVSLESISQNNSYRFYLDLNKVKNDKLHVTLITPEIRTNKIIYNIPKIIPGTYRIYNFGQYITEFNAIDKEGEILQVNRLDINRWEINNAENLFKITYWVEDTWDANVNNFVFEPSGTNIEESENFVINNHGFFGYFDDLKNYKYEINITHPEYFYGSSGLTTIVKNGNTDQLTTKNYMDLVGSPIMYNIPDTTKFKVGDTDILISVYSKNKTISSNSIAKEVKKILDLQNNYMEGLPVKKYAFIIYLFSSDSDSIALGAIEHSYSSFYYYLDMPDKQFFRNFIGTVAHEFFHILTPLNIHSEEIGDFDFINPSMSKHLWLYEGVTEYFSDHVMVYSGAISPKDYLKVIKDKIYKSNKYNDELPFTKMSLGCLDEYEDQFSNVYLKGALIGLCLDIILRENSNGKMGMINMINNLSKEYNKDKSFKDDDLFDKIAEISTTKLKSFFNEYVEGHSALPMEEIFEKVGITFKRDIVYNATSIGFNALNYNSERNRYYVLNEDMDEFAKDLGYKPMDEIVSINEIVLTKENLQVVIGRYKRKAEIGDKIDVVVARKVNDSYINKKLRAKVRCIEKRKKYLIEFDENANNRQLQLRKAWLNQK